MVIAGSFRPSAIPGFPNGQEYSAAGGEVIFDCTKSPIGLYWILEGLVQTGIDGSSRTLQLVRPGELIGFGSWRDNSPEWAKAVIDTKMVTIDRDALPRLMAESVPFRNFVIAQLLERLMQTEVLLNRRAETIANRLGHTLLDLAEPMLLPAHAPQRLAPVPHRILASYLGTSREMITVALNRFKRLGLVHYTRREMFVNGVALQRYLRV